MKLTICITLIFFSVNQIVCKQYAGSSSQVVEQSVIPQETSNYGVRGEGPVIKEIGGGDYNQYPGKGYPGGHGGHGGYPIGGGGGAVGGKDGCYPGGPCLKPSGIFPDPSSCCQFIQCSHCKVFVQKCAPKTHFNPYKLVCDHPEKAKCHGPDKHCHYKVKYDW